MSENATRRVLEPSARGPVEGRFHDWRGMGHDAEVEAARGDARRLVGAAVDGRQSAAWAEAEAAVQRLMALAQARLGARRDDPAAQRLLRQVLTAPDTRARYVFAEDLLHWFGR